MISFYTRSLGYCFFRRPPCWNKLDAARTIQHVTTRGACRVVTCRDVTQQVELGLDSCPGRQATQPTDSPGNSEVPASSVVVVDPHNANNLILAHTRRRAVAA